MSFEMLKSTVLIAGLVFLALITDYLVKRASESEAGYLSWYFILSIPIVLLAAAGWLQAMRMETLAGIGLLEASISIMGLTLMGTLLFQESLPGATVIAIMLAFSAVAIQTIWG